MAKRYSGGVTFDVVYHDGVSGVRMGRGHYKVRVSANGRHYETFSYHEKEHITKAVDSPAMYDEIAEAAASRLLHDGDDISGLLDTNRSGLPVVNRTAPAKTGKRSVGGESKGPKRLTKQIVDARRTARPNYGMAVDGYTKRSGAPTSIEIKLKGEKIWRRLMIWQFSNAGTTFVNILGEPHIVDSTEVEVLLAKRSGEERVNRDENGYRR